MTRGGGGGGGDEDTTYGRILGPQCKDSLGWHMLHGALYAYSCQMIS